LLAKPSPLNINLGSDRFSMFNKKRDIPAWLQDHMTRSELAHSLERVNFTGGQCACSPSIRACGTICYGCCGRLLAKRLWAISSNRSASSPSVMPIIPHVTFRPAKVRAFVDFIQEIAVGA
jgi:hypothetical protein